MKFQIIFIALSLISSGSCLKILGVIAFGSHSHFSIGDAIMKTLHSAGHEITVISSFPNKDKLDNYRDISTPDLLDKFKNDQLFDAFEFRGMGAFGLMMHIYKMGEANVNSYLTHPKIIDLMNSGENFDVCIFENFNAEAFLGMVDHFNCTLITYSTFTTVVWTDEMTSNQSPESYVPHPFLDFTEHMTFLERMANYLTFTIEKILFHFYNLPVQRQLFKKYFPNANRSLDDILKSSAIIFFNGHVSVVSPRPHLPNMIEIGGIHVKKAKPLPNDIQEFLDSADDGAILFSMGSIIKATNWPVEKREAFVKAFGKLKIKVLWKYENETLPDKPDNVMISKWLPQRDILAHKNIKLFITHGGLLGTTEAIYQGVPFLGIPVYGDQMMNVAKSISRGNALQILYEEINEDVVTETLNEILDNPKYMKAARSHAKRFNDRPLTPQQEVIYWTEYAARHKGASHLRAAGNDLNYIQFHLYDVYFTIFLIVALVMLFSLACFKYILKLVAKIKTTSDKMKSQ